MVDIVDLIASIFTLILVAFASDYSPQLGAIASTAPLTTTLAPGNGLPVLASVTVPVTVP